MDHTTVICSNKTETQRMLECRDSFMVQGEIQTIEVLQPLSKKRQNICGDDSHSSQQTDTNGQRRTN